MSRFQKPVKQAFKGKNLMPAKFQAKQNQNSAKKQPNPQIIAAPAKQDCIKVNTKKKPNKLIFAMLFSFVFIGTAIAIVFLAANTDKEKYPENPENFPPLTSQDTNFTEISKTMNNVRIIPSKNESELNDVKLFVKKQANPVYQLDMTKVVPHQVFAKNFIEKVCLIEPGIPQTLKREMLNTCSINTAKISLCLGESIIGKILSAIKPSGR